MPTWNISEVMFNALVYVSMGVLGITIVVVLGIFFKEAKGRKIW